jgi:hypothetical protein
LSTKKYQSIKSQFIIVYQLTLVVAGKRSNWVEDGTLSEHLACRRGDVAKTLARRSHKVSDMLRYRHFSASTNGIPKLEQRAAQLVPNFVLNRFLN